MIPQIDLKRQHEALRAELLDAAARVLDSCRFILGPEGQGLERGLAELCGARHGVGTGSGTDALLLALKAVGVRPGDEVITSAFSFVASATTIVMAGRHAGLRGHRAGHLQPGSGPGGARRSRRGPAPSCRSTSTGRWRRWTPSAIWPGRAAS